MANLIDYVQNSDLEYACAGRPVLIKSALSEEVVIAETSAKAPAGFGGGTNGFPEPTAVFHHETIAMMMAGKHDKVEELAKLVKPDSLVLPLVSKGGVWANVTLGRSAAADLHLDDPTASVIHATFEIGAHDYPFVMKDMDSSNGTYVNCERIQPYVPVNLASGDCVRFGHSIFYFLNDSHFTDLLELFREKQ